MHTAHGMNVARQRGEGELLETSSGSSPYLSVGGTAPLIVALTRFTLAHLTDAIFDCEATLLWRTNVAHLRDLRTVHDYVDPASRRDRTGGR